ncbi:MAG: hypothetical protein IK092_04770 [Muribaculaceae bacterium]|nr:hypothetical protein [Muribaculaceae bacterium]
MKSIIILSSFLLTTVLASYSCSKLNPEIENNDSILRFRYERYEVDKYSKSEVITWGRNDYGTSFYIREMGNNTAWNYNDIDIDAALDSLRCLAMLLETQQYAYTDLDKADKNKSRWLLRIITTSGKDVSIVAYSQSPRDEDDVWVSDFIEKIAKQQLALMEENRFWGEHSKITYDAKGNRTREIYYDSEGRVHGGYDADDPMLDF